jgi:hypothetical protein
VFPQFKQDLLHLEGGEDRFDQDGGFDCSPGDVQQLLGAYENVVPEPRFEVMFQLGQIKINPAAAVESFASVVEKIEGEIEQAAGSGLAVEADVLLRQVPASRTHQQGGYLRVQPVLFAIRVGKFDSAAHRVTQV